MKYIFNPFTSNFDALSPTALSIPSNQIFADNNGRDTYFAAHKNELESGSTFIMVGNGFQLWSGTTNPVGYSNTNWTDVSSVVKGVKGEKGDAGSIADLTALIKEYGSSGRVRFNETNKHWYFEVLDNGNWIVKAEIGASIIVDALRLIEGTKPTNIIPGEIAFYNKSITLPDGSTSVRPHFVIEDGTEFSLVVVDETTSEVEYRDPKTNLLTRIPVIYEDNTGTEFNDINKIKFTGDVELSKDAATKTLTVDISGKEVIDVPNSLLIARSNYLTYRNKIIEASQPDAAGQSIVLPAIKSIPANATFTVTNSRGAGKIVNVIANIADTINGVGSIALNDGDSITIERPIKGHKWIVVSHYTGQYSPALSPQVIIQNLGIPKGNDRLDASTIKDIAQEITRELGSNAWENGGGGNHPGNAFNAYSGFFHGDVITEQEIASLKKEILHNPVHTFYGVNNNPPSYFYICIPKVDAVHVEDVAQSPSTLGTIWVKSEVLADKVPYTIFRSPNRMYDSAPSFKLLAK